MAQQWNKNSHPSSRPLENKTCHSFCHRNFSSWLLSPPCASRQLFLAIALCRSRNLEWGEWYCKSWPKMAEMMLTGWVLGLMRMICRLFLGMGVGATTLATRMPAKSILRHKNGYKPKPSQWVPNGSPELLQCSHLAFDVLREAMPHPWEHWNVDLSKKQLVWSIVMMGCGISSSVYGATKNLHGFIVVGSIVVYYVLFLRDSVVGIGLKSWKPFFP